MAVSPQLGQANRDSATSDYNALRLVIQDVLNGTATVKLVVVKAVSGNVVNVQPMVNQVDGLGNATPHGIIYGLPYAQYQGGNSAIELTPAVGDIGLIVVCDRDISSVKATGAVSNPGSFRKFDLADGVYLGGIWGLNAAPTQYIQFTANGINIVSPTLTHNGQNIGSTHKHGYLPGTGTQTETTAPNA
jgi:hypothetical protein